MDPGAVQNTVTTLYIGRSMSLRLKVRLLRITTVLPLATYGCESKAMTSGDKKRIDAFEHWCYRRLLCVMDVEINKRVSGGQDRLWSNIKGSNTERR